ncbi:MAG TPA: ABC transporter ATP-binding protein [Mobilitalea sp.]|nr:ABC transporter ATP-binding protein [Mobilitalea sp.]
MDVSVNSILCTEGVKRSFSVAGGDTFWALKGINIDIPEGKLTILKGRSGSGKTTLINLLSALDLPTEGRILLDGNEISSTPEKLRRRLRRKEFGYVFQSVALIPVLSVYENVEFPLRMAGYKGKKEERVKECLRMVGLGNRMNHMPQELSGGEQQRVGIARAIAHKPRIVFADEPTAELDTNTGLQVVKIFKDLAEREGITFVMTTHDTELMKAGDKLYELEDGEIIG